MRQLSSHLTLAFGLLLLQPGPVRSAGSCGDARYLPDGSPSQVSGLPFAALRLAGGRLEIESPCESKALRLLPARRGTRGHGRLRRCPGERSALHVEATLSRSCETVTGTVWRSLGKRQSFLATRSHCGDGKVDTTLGEACDQGKECGAGLTCNRCKCVGLVAVTTTIPSPRPTTTTEPNAVCGDDRIETLEVCDTTQVAGHTCQSEGFSEGGPFGCKATCDGFDTNACYVCGNGIKEGPEECDTNDFGGPGLNACNGPWPEHGGQLSCTDGQLPNPQFPAACVIDRWSCWICGDGYIDPGEECDDHNLVAGDGCSPTCQRECGDGVVERTEECDDGNNVAGDGCDNHCNSEQTYFGGNNEVASGFHYDQCVLRWGVEAPAGSTQGAVTQQTNGLTISCRDNASVGPNACDRDTSPNQCTFLVFYCLKNDPLDGVSCSARNTSRVALLEQTTLDGDAQAAVLDSFGATMVSVGGAGSFGFVATQVGELQAIAPDVPVNTATGIAPMCGALEVVVPRQGNDPASLVLAVKVTDTSEPPRDDVDAITFVCDPPAS